MDPARLKPIPLFADLDEETLRAVATFAGETSVPAGKELVKEGDYAHEFMAIEEGEAEVLRGGQRVATLGPGDFFGEIAVLEKTLRTATVVATTPMRLVTLTHWDLKRVGGAIEKIRETLEERKRENA
jgi:CRP/FNR family cyclic AMP-dependent transcriptional regulator